MAASTVVPPHSTSSSGSSTPWLSPEASDNPWSRSYSTSADLSRRSSSGSTSANALNSGSPSSSRDPHSQEWWEHVLPPGQLAERLRKAQRSSSASRRRNNPALAKATPSERSAWKRLSGLPKDYSHDRSEPSTTASSRRSSFQASASTLPRSAQKSSHRAYDDAGYHASNLSQSESSTEVSADEHGGASNGQPSPKSRPQYAFPSGSSGNTEYGSSRKAGIRTTSNSPEFNSSTWSASSTTSPSLASINVARSSGGRRMRVMSEDGMASSVFSSTQTLSSYHLPTSYSSGHLHPSASRGDNNSWSGSATDRVRARFIPHSLPDTPEISSDEAADTTSFTTTTTTQRIRKTSTTKTTVRSSSRAPSPPTILRSHFDRPDQPPCPLRPAELDEYTSPSHRERHVSFDTATEIPRQATVEDWPEHSIPSSYSAFNFGTLPRDHASPFDTLPPRSNSTRRPRQGIRTSGRRASSFSLPGSRRGSYAEGSTSQFAASGMATSSLGHRRSSSISDLMMLDSLNVAHKQLASAGHLALTLTRQLSAPLRPVLHMTLFLGISSITVLSLACFLCASYLLTAWDDVDKRTQKVGRAAGTARYKFERTLKWGIRVIAPGEGGMSNKSTSAESHTSRSSTASAGSASKDAATASRGPVSTAGHAFLWPARMALSGAAVVAHRVTPPTISKMFKQDTKAKAKTSSLPPRPPLSTLLPSILFTLLLALGAGLNSFLVSRRAAAEAATPGMHKTHDAAPQPYTVPSGTSSPAMGYADLASSPSASPFLAKPLRRGSTPSSATAFVR